MTSKRPKPVPRKPRADAQRNRARILEIAKDAFTRSGMNTSLDDVARQARIGPGTLYRHFPTRDSLLEAVYRTEVEKLAAAEGKFAGSMPSVEALRAWMLLFVDYIAAKHLIAPALNNIVGGPRSYLKLPALRSKELSKRWSSERSKAATSVLISILSICSGLWLAFRMWRPDRTGCKAQRDWWTFSFSARARMCNQATRYRGMRDLRFARQIYATTFPSWS